MQPGTRSLDVLHLLAESDWLSSSRGWGITFTTTGCAQDTFAQTQRIAVFEESAMASKARRSGRPILKLKPALLIPRPEQLKENPSAPQLAQISSLGAHNWHAEEPPPVKGPLVTQPQGHQLADAPYKYQEPRDEQAYLNPKDTKRPCKTSVRLITLLTGLILMSLATGYLIYFKDNLFIDKIAGADSTSTGQQPLPPAYASLLAESIQDIEQINKRFIEIATRPYEHKLAQEMLLDLHTLSLAAAKHAAPEIWDKLHKIHSIISSLAHPHEGAGTRDYASTLHTLIDYSEELELELEPLVRFYFLHRTQSYSPQQWANQMSEAERLAILKTLHEQQLYSLSNDPELYAYIRSLDRHDPVNRHYLNSPQTFEDIISTYAHLNKSSLIVINAGDPIPLLLQNIFQHSPMAIDQGALVISPLVSEEWRCRLQKGKHSIEIAPQDQGKVKQFKLLTKGVPTPNQQMQMRADTRFYQFLYQQKSALLTLTLSASPRTNRYLFVPHIRQQLHTRASHYSLPDLTPESFIIEEEDIESIPSDSWQPYAQLRLTEEHRARFPWKVVQTNLELINPPLIELPSIRGFSNEISIESPSEQRARPLDVVQHSLGISKMPNFPYLEERYRIQLQRNFNFKSILEYQFYKLANSCTTQQSPLKLGYYSIATLYRLLLDLDEAASSAEIEQHMSAYFKLYQNSEFAAQINLILSEYPNLQLDPGTVRGTTTRDKFARTRFTERLSSPEHRTLIRQQLRAHLSEHLYESYNTLKSRAQGSPPNPESELMLQRLEKKDNKLIWHFRLIETAPPTSPSRTAPPLRVRNNSAP